MKQSLLESMIIRGQKQLITYILSVFENCSSEEVSEKVELYMQQYFDLIAERCLWHDESNDSLHMISMVNFSYNVNVCMNGDLDVDINTRCMYHNEEIPYDEFMDCMLSMLEFIFTEETCKLLVGTILDGEDMSQEVLLCKRVLYRTFLGYHIFSIVYRLKSEIKEVDENDRIDLMMNIVSSAISWSDIVNTDSETMVCPIFQVDGDGLFLNNAIVYVNNR